MFLKLCVLGILLIQWISCSEPQCSRFHYEEQTLLKMLKLEIIVEKMKEDIQSTQQKMLETLQAIQQEKDELKRNYDELKQSNQADMTKYAEEIKELKDARRPVIMFQSRELKNLAPSTGETLIFKQTTLNEGYGYNNSTGIFTAPVTGLYIFTTQLCPQSSNSVGYDLVAEHKNIQRGFFLDRSHGSCHTTDGLAVLKEGHRVWIEMQYSAGLAENESSTWNSFSGVLLHI